MFHSKGYYRIHNDLNGKNKTFIIEIIGPAGVGKSTFIDKVKKGGLISRYKVPKINIDNALKNKTLGVDFHAKLFQLKVNNELPEGRGLHRFQDMLLWLFRDQYLQLPKNQGKIFLVDEGLGHHFTSELIDAHKSDPGLFNAAINNRGFIALTAKPETIAKRIVGRKEKTKHILPYHDKKSPKQLEAYLNNRMKSISRLISVARQAGIPCLELNSEEPIKNHLNVTASFLKTLI